jgi:tRNA pseudouridine(38-40) synthase
MTQRDREATVLNGKIYFRIFYDGAHYYGWAKQKAKPTIQGALEHAVASTGGHLDSLRASSRTDARVSAVSQIVGVQGSNIRPDAINAVLPPDVAITHYATRLEGIYSKTYVYVRVPRWRDPELVAQAVAHLDRHNLIGALYKKGGAAPVNRIKVGLVSAENCEYVFFKAEGFGYQQVRKIMGYLDLVDSRGELPRCLPSTPVADPRGLILLNTEAQGDWVKLEQGVSKATKHIMAVLKELEWSASIYRLMLGLV